MTSTKSPPTFRRQQADRRRDQGGGESVIDWRGSAEWHVQQLIRPGRLASLRNEVCHLRQSLFKLVIACVLTLSIMCLALRMKGE